MVILIATSTKDLRSTLSEAFLELIYLLLAVNKLNWTLLYIIHEKKDLINKGTQF